MSEADIDLEDVAISKQTKQPPSRSSYATGEAENQSETQVMHVSC